MARRPKCTLELIDEAAKLKTEGMTDKDICATLGIHPSSFYRWLNNPKTRLERELSDALKKAEAYYKQALTGLIKQAAIERSSNWTAAAWLLERKFPDEYARREREREEKRMETPQLFVGVELKPYTEASSGELPCTSMPEGNGDEGLG